MRTKEKKIKHDGPGKPRSANSTLSFGGFGLEPEEDQWLVEALKDKDITGKQLVRALIRQWREQGAPGAIVFGGVHTSLKRAGK